ncbi:hypothetical protein SDC9_201637 [bioreactor metagenome]|uniref:Uncharacterized protein n=1 Tax=bioreactor metagenome TaxID=1076179 RepID=A0A645IRH6_9ZZZZ
MKIPDRANYGHSLNMTGYAHLEPPQLRKNTREAEYLHVWAEPVFSLVHQGSLDEKGWWRRVSLDHGTVWQGSN